ncbi:MAG: RnfABCDGE type electron transport complex subunit A [Candidatus Omnitrophica bacterium]|nr:RnfABCDGE type electron transport complex subunit A [Candidatus Omnitrophota bacterium]
MDLSKFIVVIISMVFVNNFILSKFLGLCPFIGVSKNIKPAMSMGMAVTFVAAMSSVITWLVYAFVLIPFKIEYLRTITFVLVIAGFVQFVEMVIRKTTPVLYRALGIYLPLITTNCAILGVTVLNSDTFFGGGMNKLESFLLSLTQGVFAGVGFTLALLLMSGIRERLELTDVPEVMKGVPLAFVIASLMSLAFMGFSGFKIH